MKNELENNEVPWKNLVSICEKCGKKLATKDENPSHETRSWLKEEIKERGLKGKIRAVTTSCLDVCPEGKIAVVFTGKNPPKCVLIDPEKDRETLLQMVISKSDD